MQYVRRNQFLTLKKMNKNWVHLENHITNESWNISNECARVLYALDGKTDPQKVMKNLNLNEKEMDKIIDYYEEQGWLYDGSRITLLGLGSVLFSLFIPNVKKRHRVIARIWNRLLMLLCLPIFASGVYILMRSDYRYIDHGYGFLIGYIVGIFTGMLFHEMSHACACLSYGGHWFETGVMFAYFMPGAYVAIDYKKVKSRFRRVQICASGMECNLALAGMFLLLLKTEIFDTDFLIFASLTNLVFVVFNLSLIGGFDGMAICSEILGVDHLVDKAINLTCNFKGKKEFRKRGINEKATIACCYIVIIFQILLVIILIMNVISIISAFIL